MQAMIRRNFKFVLLFVFFFFCLQFFYSSFQGDLIYNYGFSYAISRGEIPYRDFNMIIPPFGAFFYAIPFLLFGSNLVVLNLFQALLICLLFWFLFRLFDKKTYLFIPILCMTIPIPFATSLFAGYNFLLLLELVILIYLEKNNGNDYLIGVVLGFCILTKQTVGFFLCLVSFYYLFKDSKKVFRRIIGLLIPCSIFFIYLLVTKTFMSFLDMCLFGMLDFTSSNGTIRDYNFILYIVLASLVLYRIIKDKLDINNYYVFAFSTVAVPLFDYYHVTLAILAFLFLVVDKIKINYKELTLGFNCFLFALSLALIWFGFKYEFSPNITNFNRFEGKIMNKSIEKETKEINKFIKKNKDKNLIILGANAYFFKITNDLDINHYDLLNYGNHGYNGTNKIIEMIKNEKDPIFIININEYEDDSSSRQQINKDVMKFVKDNYEIKKTIGEYVVYKGVKDND